MCALGKILVSRAANNDDVFLTERVRSEADIQSGFFTVHSQTDVRLPQTSYSLGDKAVGYVSSGLCYLLTLTWFDNVMDKPLSMQNLVICILGSGQPV